jgi:nitronate monooxygenase
MEPIAQRVTRFCERFGLRLPLLLAPMSGVPAPELSAAVAAGGGLGGCGVLMMSADEIRAWGAAVAPRCGNAFQLNNWIRDPAPARDAAREAAVADFLGRFGPQVSIGAGDGAPPDFRAQWQAMLALRPRVISSVMGLLAPGDVQELKRSGIAWFANISTVTEARAAAAAGADVIVAQGMEAGGHRAAFDPSEAELRQVGLLALLPAVVDAVAVPVVAAGGIADGRGIAAALLLGASAVQIGTGYLRCPEAAIPAAWADALAATPPEGTHLTRAFSGRAGRSLATDYVRAAAAEGAPPPAPYPVQRGLTAAMRRAATERGDLQRMQAWAGQSAALARAAPAAELTQHLWREATQLLASAPV